MSAILRSLSFAFTCSVCIDHSHGRRVQTAIVRIRSGSYSEHLHRHRPGDARDVLDTPGSTDRLRLRNASDSLSSLLLAYPPIGSTQQQRLTPSLLIGDVLRETQRSHIPVVLHGASVSHPRSENEIQHKIHPTTPLFARRRNFESIDESQACRARSAEPRMVVDGVWVFRVPFVSPLVQDILAALTFALAAKIWIKLWSEMAKREYLPATLTRKLIHTGTGPMFVIGWAFFSNSPTAIFAACAVPIINLTRLWLASRASSTNTDKAELVSALSRSGAAGEVAKGPFYYTLVLLAATALSFRALPGAIAVCQMAVGDGLADIIGRNFGKTKWAFAKNKTVEGSIAFVLGAFAASLGMVAGAHAIGYTLLTVRVAALPLLAISVACACVELFSGFIPKSLGDLADDNLTVPLAGGILAAVLNARWAC